MPDCIFCQIVEGKSPAEVEYEDTQILAFWDVHPHAPIDILVIPKKHIDSLTALKENEANLAGKMLWVAKTVAEKKRLEAGYRLVINCGQHAGQVVNHLHLHLLGGKSLGPMVS